MRAKYLVIGVVVGVLLSSAVVVLAGNLDPPSGPTTAASQMVTLEQIYQRLDTGATDGKMTSFTEPASAPGTGTMHTLNDIMGAAPAVDDTGGAAPGEVLAGKTYWGLRSGAWGPQTGTAAAGNNVNGPQGARTFAIPDGFYEGKTATANDADLAAGNIKSGVDIFGVTGTYPLAAVPRTGVTETLVTGDDGDLEKGVAWPNPRFTDNSDGTVTDNLTGLIWLRNANCNGIKNWANALSWANGLYDGCASCGGTNNDCGLTDGSAEGDWRLPNVRELQSLIHYGFNNPALPNAAGTGKWSEGDPFTGVLAGYYWMGTYASGTSNAWVVLLSDGSVGGEAKTVARYVWPVRGGQ